MPFLRAHLLVLAVLLSANGQATPKPVTADPLCTYFEAVLHEAPTKFAALRAKPLKGFSIPVWEGKMKAPGSTRCQATEKSYVCSLGFRPDQTEGKREFDGLALRTFACFSGWSGQQSRRDSDWTFLLARDDVRIGVVYECLDACGFKEDPRPELLLVVHIRDKVSP